jgi:hypothetical protein
MGFPITVCLKPFVQIYYVSIYSRKKSYSFPTVNFDYRVTRAGTQDRPTEKPINLSKL